MDTAGWLYPPRRLPRTEAEPQLGGTEGRRSSESWRWGEPHVEPEDEASALQFQFKMRQAAPAPGRGALQPCKRTWTHGRYERLPRHRPL